MRVPGNLPLLRVLAIRDNLIACDQTCYYPGGGGQPPDEGILKFAKAEAIEVESTHPLQRMVSGMSAKQALPQLLLKNQFSSS